MTVLKEKRMTKQKEATTESHGLPASASNAERSDIERKIATKIPITRSPNQAGGKPIKVKRQC